MNCVLLVSSPRRDKTGANTVRQVRRTLIMASLVVPRVRPASTKRNKAPLHANLVARGKSPQPVQTRVELVQQAHTKVITHSVKHAWLVAIQTMEKSNVTTVNRENTQGVDQLPALLVLQAHIKMHRVKVRVSLAPQARTPIHRKLLGVVSVSVEASLAHHLAPLAVANAPLVDMLLIQVQESVMFALPGSILI